MDEDVYEETDLIIKMIEAQMLPGPRTLEILGCHFAAEEALDDAIARLLSRPEKLPTLGFVQKVKLVAAMMPGASGDATFDMLERLNILRNAAAHRKERKNIPAIYSAILGETSELFGKDCTGSLALELATQEIVMSLQAMLSARERIG